MDHSGNAFPMPGLWDGREVKPVNAYYDAGGMSLRDYFAGKALQGMLAGTPGSHLVPPNAARLAYEYADAMLKEKD